MTEQKPIDLDDDGGDWEPSPLEARVSLWALWLMVLIVVVSAVAGWPWPQ